MTKSKASHVFCKQIVCKPATNYLGNYPDQCINCALWLTFRGFFYLGSLHRAYIMPVSCFSQQNSFCKLTKEIIIPSPRTITKLLSSLSCIYISMWVIVVRNCNVIFYKGPNKTLHFSKFGLQTTQTSLNYGKEDN